ncbi:MAG: hypothetical protein V2J11_11845 [Desulfofustis sp.]|jgi:hypothetical protein|nr:hypothetical protein [Desulfofustis sp.]
MDDKKHEYSSPQIPPRETTSIVVSIPDKSSFLAQAIDTAHGSFAKRTGCGLPSSRNGKVFASHHEFFNRMPSRAVQFSSNG